LAKEGDKGIDWGRMGDTIGRTRGDSMTMTLSELRKLSKKELWTLYDQEAKQVMPSLNYY
jgi:hypothetical protein